MYFFSVVLLMLAAQVAVAADLNSKFSASQAKSILSQAERLKTDERIGFLENAIKSNPKDLQIKSALAAAFIQKLRETGDASYLKRASGIVDAVLAVDPGIHPAQRLRNEVAMNLHQFAKVADYAETMLANDPGDAATVGLLGDAQMELGQYDRAGETYKRMVSLGANLFSYNRLAYYHFVTGDSEAALAWMAQALAAGSRSPENLAWCYSDMGGMLFKVGRIADAEVAYRYALQTFPGYHRAYAGLGRVLAARGELKPAIDNFVKAQAVVPLPEYAGELEVLYEATGDKAGAAHERALLETVAKLMAANGEKANRTLALIDADRDRNLDRAVQLARAEFEVRKDVYSYDALSWVLYRRREYAEAQDASKKALTLGTPEPGFYFHAGMLAIAGGDLQNGKADLEKALQLNPHFDLANAAVAQAALKQIANPAN